MNHIFKAIKKMHRWVMKSTRQMKPNPYIG
jgi:hypothetical protein